MHGTACAIPASYDAAIFTSLVDGAPKGILAPGPMAQFWTGVQRYTKNPYCGVVRWCVLSQNAHFLRLALMKMEDDILARILIYRPNNVLHGGENGTRNPPRPILLQKYG